MEGRVAVRDAGTALGRVGAGEVVGELALLSGEPHSLSAIAEGSVVTATLGREQLAELGRRRPDIGLVLYRNFAVALGGKLRRVDRAMLESLRPGG
jgi:CRP-like cAMP-binding protein